MGTFPFAPRSCVRRLRSHLEGSRAGSSWLLLTQSRCSANLAARPVLTRSSLTSDEEVTSHNEHQADWGQHEASTVSVVLIAHKTDAAHRVPIHLEQEGVGGQSQSLSPSPKSNPLRSPPPTSHNTWATARIATVRTKGSDQVRRWK